MNKYIIVHYHEIALKGRNRINFEKKLQANIKKALHGLDYKEVGRIYGRILIELSSGSDLDEIRQRLLNVFGIAYFIKVESCSLDIKEIKECVLDIFKREYGNNKFKTFKIEARRAQKKFPLTSQEINAEVGAHILENFKEKIKVKLDNPEFACHVDITDKEAFIYLKKIKGLGGLPTGTAGKVITLISSGFDSPLASWKIMKRGAVVSFVHFHSYPQTDKLSLENVKKIVEILNYYQFKSTLYLIPFLNIQKEISLKTKSSLRVVLYRRMMIRIAEMISGKEKARALVTGESLGQVASQTLENIQAINEAATLPILRPLIGQDKEDIINETKKIGTFEISSKPYEDCCTLFVPKHPETKADLNEVKKEEEKLDVEKLTNEALEKIEIIKYAV